MFRAYDAQRERLVAVKVFKLDLPPEQVHRLVAELDRLVAAELTHPSLAAPLAAGITGVSAFLAQDYVAAESLDLSLRQYGPASPADALRIAAQLARALDFAAVADVDHGALHPRDVLNSTDETRLTGVGVARALERIGVSAPVRRPYTAPERMAGGAWDRRADVFSLAAVMHEVLWGRRLAATGELAADGLTQIAGAHLATLQATFVRALADDPTDRFETALEFAEALKGAFPHVALLAPAAPPVKSRRKRLQDEDRDPAVEIQQPSTPERAEEHLRLPLDAPDDLPLALGDLPPVDDFRSAFDALQPESDVVRLPAHDARVTTDDARLRTDDPRLRTDDARLRTDDSRLTTDDARLTTDDARLTTDDSRLTTDDPRLTTDVPPPTPLQPSGFITGLDADASVIERSRSAVWPIGLALVVGIALGFGGGYGLGVRDRSASVAASSPSASVHEFTERAVSEPTRAAAPTRVEDPKIIPPEPAAEKKDAPPAESRSAAGPGRLVIRSTPAGATVAVDGHESGRTPLTVRELQVGAHRVEITQEGFAPAERRVTITRARAAQSLTVALDRVRTPSAAPAAASVAPAPATSSIGPGTLQVESRPAGATVYVDGRIVGTTPLSQSVTSGEHGVRLELAGYRDWTSSVRVAAAATSRVTASLER